MCGEQSLYLFFTCKLQSCFFIVLRSYPVALEASAELLDNLALISIIQYSRDSGCSAYCILHSPTMPKCRTT